METKLAMQKSVHIEAPVITEIHERRSRRAYSDTPIEQEKITSLFEAARWAPSSNNEQPWTYLYATKDQTDLWSKLFSLLDIGNQSWATNAQLLILSLARKNFVRNDQPNGSAKYDLGGANAFISLQATQLGLNVHQMGGYDRLKAKEILNIPDTYEFGVVMAIGYLGDIELLPENLKKRELSPRERYVQSEFVFNKSF
ncbi:MAG TPA: nitroreductase family protein [Chryseolinea sp.]|nr:nitroreductase family protein [Chryseolinea sp.]HPH46424.1 nitroreductase family protein [Chryseolinea sp.]HPM31860.1 nitroreductase family protein [Chryseolinea sp.]